MCTGKDVGSWGADSSMMGASGGAGTSGYAYGNNGEKGLGIVRFWRVLNTRVGCI